MDWERPLLAWDPGKLLLAGVGNTGLDKQMVRQNMAN